MNLVQRNWYGEVTAAAVVHVLHVTVKHDVGELGILIAVQDEAQVKAAINKYVERTDAPLFISPYILGQEYSFVRNVDSGVGNWLHTL